jgi:hypothetical protein
MHRSLLTVALALIATPVWAQQVNIAFHDGQVSVETVGAPPRSILAEWSRIGGTNIVNGERVTGAPLTLKLQNVPEAQALEIILRSVAGYMAAPRGQTPGASRYDRILVLPTSSIQVAASPTPSRPGGPPSSPAAAQPRFIPPRPSPPPAEEPAEPELAVESPQDEQPVFVFPQPSQPGYGGSTPVPPMAHPETAGFGPATPGVYGAPMPGMVQVPPAPKPVAPGRPRPPGQ